jgi:hypothetical protein
MIEQFNVSDSAGLATNGAFISSYSWDIEDGTAISNHWFPIMIINPEWAIENWHDVGNVLTVTVKRINESEDTEETS